MDDQTEPESGEEEAGEPSRGKGDPVAPRDNGPAESDPEALREKWLRALADLDNLRKRTGNMIESAVLNERRAILGAFLEVVDSLDRALAAHAGEENEWIRGLDGIRRQNLEILRRFDVDPVQCLGDIFDPHQHDAVARVPDPDRPEGEIIEVVQTGYAFRSGAILRPPRVIVSHRDQ